MNTAAIKALTRQIEDRLGTNRAAAIVAGVSPSVWSTYCSDEHPTITIPFGRLLMVASAVERAQFAKLLIAEGADEPPGDLVAEVQEVTEEAAVLQRHVRLAAASGMTKRKARSVVAEALHLEAEVAQVIRLAERAA